MGNRLRLFLNLLKELILDGIPSFAKGKAR